MVAIYAYLLFGTAADYRVPAGDRMPPMSPLVPLINAPFAVVPVLMAISKSRELLRMLAENDTEHAAKKRN